MGLNPFHEPFFPAFSVCIIASLVLISLLGPCACYNPKSLNVSASYLGWKTGDATWYGDPNGAGSTGGACGYGDAVEKPPFSFMVSAGGPSLFRSGKGCGACYQVKCTSNAACSGKPVTVVITDECSGGPCLAASVHFDMSGAAFGAMALPGKAGQLRNVGVLRIQYSRVPCHYPGFDVAFHVDAGSNPYYFAVVIQYQSGDGDLSAVEFMQQGSPSASWRGGRDGWEPMQQSWGAVWKLNSGSPLKGPFSIRLTSLSSHRTSVACKVIPVTWRPRTTYWSRRNDKNCT